MNEQPREGRGRFKTGVVVVVCLFLIGLVMAALGGGPHSVQGRPSKARAKASPLVRQEPVAPAGDFEQEPTLPIATGRANGAGKPRTVAREFALAWINRPSARAGIRAENQRLIALSRGPWADQVGASLTANRGSGSQGTVVGVQEIMRRAGTAIELVTTREHFAPHGKALEPYHYGLYLARLERVAKGFAISSWEPQF